MKPQSISKPKDGTFLADIVAFNGQAFKTYPEPVNFPSTADVFHAVFENSLHASCIGNCDGRMLEVNEKCCKIFGYSEKEMIQLSTTDIFDTAESRYIEYLAQINSGGKGKSEVTGLRKTGERFSCKISSMIFIDDNGERRTINTMHDMGNTCTQIPLVHNTVY